MQDRRKPRILWANVYCLLDTTSGASISVREMMRQLALTGCEVGIVGATVFDSLGGMSALPENWKRRLETTDILELRDDMLVHRLLMTGSPKRDEMTCLEEAKWYEFYVHTLDTFKPDLVWFYGGRPLDYLISDEAKQRGIAVAAYLSNGNYVKTRWCRDVDCIITDTQATADYYQRKNGLTLIPVGKFIDPVSVVASSHSRKNLLFVNPSIEKGAAIVIQLAQSLENTRPDICFEVVESRGNWGALVRSVGKALGRRVDKLDNVVVTPHTRDMRSVYGRARLLLSPSLWWESGSRVVAEAMMNAIPAIVTDRGGNFEMAGQGGIRLRLPDLFYEAPYTELLTPELLELFSEHIVSCYDDEVFYGSLVAQARMTGEPLFDMGKSVGLLLDTFDSIIANSA